MHETSSSQLDLNRLYTYADYLTWHFDEAVELIKGRIFKISPAPRSAHQFISMDLSILMVSKLKEQPCRLAAAPFDVRFPTKQKNHDYIITVCQPDLCAICDRSKIDQHGCLRAPDLIAEIISPSTAEKDLKKKLVCMKSPGSKNIGS